METAIAVGIAGFGGFMINVMNLWEETKKLKSDRVPKDALYWSFFVGWPFISAALAYIYILDGSKLHPSLAFSVGLGAPATLRAIATAAQPAGPPRNAEP